MIAGDPVPGQRQPSSKTKSAKDKDIGDRDDRACTSETQKLLEFLAKIIEKKKIFCSRMSGDLR